MRLRTRKVTDGRSWKQAQFLAVGQTDYAKATPVEGEHRFNPFAVCQMD
jgi:hypothetical protein